MELKKQPISSDSATEDDKQGELQAGLPLDWPWNLQGAMAAKSRLTHLEVQIPPAILEAVALLIPKMMRQPTKHARAS